MTAPSTGSLSQNSMPIDLLVRADFEQWLQSTKGVRSNGPNLKKSELAAHFNEYVQMRLPTFTYSPGNSETVNAQEELLNFIEDYDELVRLDPLNCIWDFFQRKYFHSNDDAGVDQRQARSAPSGTNANLPVFCDENGQRVD